MVNIEKEMRELDRKQSILSIQKIAILELRRVDTVYGNSIFRKILNIIEEEE